MTPEEYRLEAAHELADGAGATRMPPTAMQWLAPVGLHLDGERLAWQPRASLERRGVIVPSEGLLEDFVALTDGAPADVLAFAERHGVLGVGKQWHFRRAEPAYEPISEWQAAARRANALLHAASRLRLGLPLSDDERVPVLAAAWPDVEPARFTDRVLFLDGVAFPEPYNDADAAMRDALLDLTERTLDDDRTQLTWAVTTWMEQAGGKLVLTWPPGADAPNLTIGGGPGCLAAITVQVALACSRADTSRTCDGCGALHAPRRQPKPGQRSFCQRCRNAGVPVKLANRDRRAKQRQHQTEEATT